MIITTNLMKLSGLVKIGVSYIQVGVVRLAPGQVAVILWELISPYMSGH